MGIFSGSANLVYDPELKTGNDGSVYCRLRLANQERRYDKETKRWVKEEPIFFTMTVYKQLAKNLAQSVIAGDRLIIIGKFKLDKFLDKNGEEREDFKVVPHEVGVDLRFHAAVVEKDDEKNLDEEEPF